MTKQEIHNKVLEYNDLLKSAAGSGTFELNSQIAEYKKNLAILRKMCDHKHENGEFALDDNHFCIYCLQKIR